jgi:hypothetical protein
LSFFAGLREVVDAEVFERIGRGIYVLGQIGWSRGFPSQNVV